MNIKGKITRVVDGSGGKLFHLDGKADGQDAKLFVQKKAEGVYALALPKSPASKIGNQRVVAYQGAVVAEGKGVGHPIEFKEVYAPTRPLPVNKQDLAVENSELKKQNQEYKALAERAVAALEGAKEAQPKKEEPSEPEKPKE